MAIDLSAPKFDVHKDVEGGSPPSIFNTTIYDILVAIPRFSWLVVWLKLYGEGLVRTFIVVIRIIVNKIKL